MLTRPSGTVSLERGKSGIRMLESAMFWIQNSGKWMSTFSNGAESQEGFRYNLMDN